MFSGNNCGSAFRKKAYKAFDCWSKAGEKRKDFAITQKASLFFSDSPLLQAVKPVVVYRNTV